MSERQFNSAREYSKEEMSEERNALAEELRKLRSYDQVSTDNETRHTNESLNWANESLIELEKEILYLETSIESHAQKLKLSIIEKLFGESSKKQHGREWRTEYKEMEEGFLEDNLKKIEKQRATIRYCNHKLKELSDFRNDPNRIKAKDLLAKFHSNVAREWDKSEEDRFKELERLAQIEAETPFRTVEHITEELNVFFFHGTMVSTLAEPTKNSLMQGGVGWRKKMEVAIAIEPTISTSSFRPGLDNFENLFAGTGFLLKGGRIDHAERSDSGTVAIDADRRLLGGYKEISPENPTSLAEIKNVVTEGPRQIMRMKHNELVVSNPKPAAIYIVMENLENDRILQEAYKNPPHKDLYEFCQEVQLPVVGLLGGQLHETKFDEATGTFVLTERQVQPQDILSLGGISEGVKTSMFDDLLESQSDTFKRPILKAS